MSPPFFHVLFIFQLISTLTNPSLPSTGQLKCLPLGQPPFHNYQLSFFLFALTLLMAFSKNYPLPILSISIKRTFKKKKIPCFIHILIYLAFLPILLHIQEVRKHKSVNQDQPVVKISPVFTKSRVGRGGMSGLEQMYCKLLQIEGLSTILKLYVGFFCLFVCFLTDFIFK